MSAPTTPKIAYGVFDWALIQPAADVYDFRLMDRIVFRLMDRIVERAAAEGRSICLATGTGAHPASPARAHPEVTRTDLEGRRHRFGQRHNSCPSSPVFRRLSAELARQTARCYGRHRRVLERHGIELRYLGNRDLETAMRIAPDGSRVLFVLNHGAVPTYVTVDHAGTDLLAEQHVDAGDTVKIDGCGVMIIREDA